MSVSILMHTSMHGTTDTAWAQNRTLKCILQETSEQKEVWSLACISMSQTDHQNKKAGISGPSKIRWFAGRTFALFLERPWCVEEEHSSVQQKGSLDKVCGSTKSLSGDLSFESKAQTLLQSAFLVVWKFHSCLYQSPTLLPNLPEMLSLSSGLC